MTVDNELDLDLLAFVERYAPNPVRWDLLTFFGREPQRQESVDAITRQLDWSPSIVQRELDELTVLGLLEQVRVNGDLYFRMTRYEPLRKIALRFVAQVGQAPASNGSSVFFERKSS